MGGLVHYEKWYVSCAMVSVMLTIKESRVRNFPTIVSSESVSRMKLECCLSISEQKMGEAVTVAKKENWLLGRFAAKVAILKTLTEHHGINVPYADIEIISRTLKPPTFRLCGDRHGSLLEPSEYHLSIAHSHGVAVAQVASQALYAGIGVDVERIRTFNDYTLRNFCTEREYAEHMRAPIEDRMTDTTLWWCLKEAYLKALGTGLCTHPRMVEVIKGIEPNTVTMYYKNDEISVDKYWTRRNGNYIIVSVSV